MEEKFPYLDGYGWLEPEKLASIFDGERVLYYEYGVGEDFIIYPVDCIIWKVKDEN